MASQTRNGESGHLNIANAKVPQSVHYRIYDRWQVRRLVPLSPAPFDTQRMVRIERFLRRKRIPGRSSASRQAVIHKRAR